MFLVLTENFLAFCIILQSEFVAKSDALWLLSGEQKLSNIEFVFPFPDHIPIVLPTQQFPHTISKYGKEGKKQKSIIFSS